jgi:hypothetical protein
VRDSNSAPDLVLQVANLMAQRRLKGAEPEFGGRRQAAFLDQRHAITQVPQLHRHRMPERYAPSLQGLLLSRHELLSYCLAIGLALIILPVYCTLKLIDFKEGRYVFLPYTVFAALVVVGTALCAPGAIGLTVAMFAALILFVAVGHFYDAWYKRNYPVFETEPIRSLKSSSGDFYRLHIAEARGGFIIGIDYDDWIDGRFINFHTKWRTVFPDYCSAEQALVSRYEKLSAPPWTPPSPSPD